jgi:hypothetical protein
MNNHRWQGPFDTFEQMVHDAVDPYVEASDDGK